MESQDVVNFNLARMASNFLEFDKVNIIKQIILIGENGKVKNIEIENEVLEQ